MATRMVEGLKGKSYERRLAIHRLQTLDDRRLRGDLKLAFSIMTGGFDLPLERILTRPIPSLNTIKRRLDVAWSILFPFLDSHAPSINSQYGLRRQTVPSYLTNRIDLIQIKPFRFANSFFQTMSS